MWAYACNWARSTNFSVCRLIHFNWNELTLLYGCGCILNKIWAGVLARARARLIDQTIQIKGISCFAGRSTKAHALYPQLSEFFFAASYMLPGWNWIRQLWKCIHTLMAFMRRWWARKRNIIALEGDGSSV